MTDSRSERDDQSNVPGLGSEGPPSHSASLDIETLTAAEVTNSLGHGPSVTYVTNQLLTSGHVRFSPLVLTGGNTTGSARPMATADIQRSIAVGFCSWQLQCRLAGCRPYCMSYQRSFTIGFRQSDLRLSASVHRCKAPPPPKSMFGYLRPERQWSSQG